MYLEAESSFGVNLLQQVTEERNVQSIQTFDAFSSQ